MRTERAAHLREDGGITNNLDVARRLADEMSIMHTDHVEGVCGTWEARSADHLAKRGAMGDVTGNGACRRAIETGDIAQLKTVKCSEFTNLTLQAAGWDLTTDFLYFLGPMRSGRRVRRSSTLVRRKPVSLARLRRRWPLAVKRESRRIASPVTSNKP